MKHWILVVVLLCMGLPLGCADDSSKSTVLITGANRGIGLEYATQFADKGYHVIGTARAPEEAEELRAVAAQVVQLDVTDDDSVAALAQTLDGQAIDLLINNAGYLYRDDSTLDKVSADVFMKTIDVNTMGPIRVTQALMPNLQAGEGKTVVNMSSGLGSIANSTGGLYSYRASKTALNQINKIWSEEFKDDGFTFVVLHPGWVQTDMGGENATYTPQESVSGLIEVIDGLTADDNGKFYDLKGEPIHW